MVIAVIIAFLVVLSILLNWPIGTRVDDEITAGEGPCGVLIGRDASKSRGKALQGQRGETDDYRSAMYMYIGIPLQYSSISVPYIVP